MESKEKIRHVIIEKVKPLMHGEKMDLNMNLVDLLLTSEDKKKIQINLSKSN